MPDAEVGVTYLLDMDGLNDTEATFEAGIPGTTLIIPRERWVSLGRPGRVRVDVSNDA